jgi:hypothetical protein
MYRHESTLSADWLFKALPYGDTCRGQGHSEDGGNLCVGDKYYKTNEKNKKKTEIWSGKYPQFISHVLKAAHL